MGAPAFRVSALSRSITLWAACPDSALLFSTEPLPLSSDHADTLAYRFKMDISSRWLRTVLAPCPFSWVRVGAGSALVIRPRSPPVLCFSLPLVPSLLKLRPSLFCWHLPSAFKPAQDFPPQKSLLNSCYGLTCIPPKFLH